MDSGKTKRRRPKTACWRRVMKELEEMGVTWGKVQTKALDRDKWQCWIVALYPAMMNTLRLDLMSEDRGHLIIFNWEN